MGEEEEEKEEENLSKGERREEGLEITGGTVGVILSSRRFCKLWRQD